MPLLVQTKCLQSKDTKKMRNRQVFSCKSIKSAIKIKKNSSTTIKIPVIKRGLYSVLQYSPFLKEQ